MELILKAYWGPQKAEGRQDLIEQYVQSSEIFLSVVRGADCPRLVYIELHGILAQIPSLKNQRHPRFGGINPRNLAAIKAMDRLFISAAKEQGLGNKDLNFGEHMIHVAVIAGGRKTGNEDNAMTTVKDWLEPPTKLVGSQSRKGFRGWGIGLIKDDIQARGYALKSTDLGLSQNYTCISIQPWEHMKDDAATFMARCRLAEAA